MKSFHLYQSLGLFCIIILITSINSIKNFLRKEKGLSKKSLEGSLMSQNELSTIWANMFTGNRKQTCKSSEMKPNVLSTVNGDKKIEGQMTGEIIENGLFLWIKSWGYGHSSYLFDYFDPVFQKDIIDAFKKLYTDAKAVSNNDTELYKDPFDIKKLVPLHLRNATNINLKVYNKNYDPLIYDLSVNSVQLREVMQKWNWFFDVGETDYAVNFITKYDINGDGRLNPRELVLGTIQHNKNTLGSGLCTNCFQEIAKKIDAIFIFLDCDNDGFLSAQDLWNSLPKIIRPTSKWNIFAINNNDNIRTSAINDFVIKNGIAKRGSLSKEEFRSGLLLGYWDRQTNEKSIIEDDSRNLKKLRWSGDGMTDTIAFNFMKEQMIAKLIADSQIAKN